MDDLGFNKIAGAVLATALGMMLLMKLPGVFMTEADASIAYKVGEIETGGKTEPVVDLPSASLATRSKPAALMGQVLHFTVLWIMTSPRKTDLAILTL